MREVNVFINPSKIFITSDFINCIQNYSDLLIIDEDKRFLDMVQLNCFQTNSNSLKLSVIPIDFTSDLQISEFLDILSEYQNETFYSFHMQENSSIIRQIDSRISPDRFQLVNFQAGFGLTKKEHSLEFANHVGILLIQFDAYALTRECILSLLGTNGNKRIYLLDNASADFSGLKLFLEFPSIIMLSVQYRISYCLAFNILADYSIRNCAEHLFITNNDTKDFSNNIFEVLIANLNTEIGMISPRILDFTNEDIHWRPRTKLGVQFDIATEAYLIAAKTWLKLDGFLNSHVMYFEDLDFLLRLRKLGLDGTLDTSISMAHLGGGAVRTKIFVPTFFSLRNSLWIMRITTGKRLSGIMLKFFWHRSKVQFAKSLSDIKKGLYLDAMRRIVYIFTALGLGLTTKPRPNRPKDLEMAFQQKRTQLKFWLK